MYEWRLRNRKRIDHVLSLFVTLLIAAFTLIPLFWILSTSFKPMGAEYLIPIELWPKEPTLQAYRAVIVELDFLVPLRNSFIVSFSVAVL